METVDEPVDLFGDRVQVEARARRRSDTESGHQRLRAVVTCADGNAFPVEDLRDVVRMDAGHLERDDPGAALDRRPEQPHPVELTETLHRVPRELVLVLLDRGKADTRDVVDRGAEPDRLGDCGCSGLELVRKLVERRPVEADRPDHLAAEVERRHRLEQLAPAPECADTGRAAQLVRRESEKVTVERLHVDRPVRRRLSGVDDDDRALRMSPRRELLDRIDRAERVRDEADAHDLDRVVARKVVERVELELARVVDRYVPECRTRLDSR